MRRRVTRRCLLATLVLALLLPASPPPAAAEQDPVAETVVLARGFLQAFAAKDMQRVGAMFAPGARVQRARLGEGAPELASFDAAAWLAEAGPSIEPLEDFRIEVLEAQGLEFGDGVVVALRFRATGGVGGGHFINDGIDTYSFARVDGAWRIVLYQSIEKLVFFPPEAPSPADDGAHDAPAQP